MCGIAGFLSSSLGSASERQQIALKMGLALRHRGPDDEGLWQDDSTGIAFCFRRLAILDLSENGRQPMHSASERYTLQFNGEIYNYLEIKKELLAAAKGPAVFRGTSDTEVILAALDAWGITATLEKLNGMFAIAVWDRETRSLLLARDRMGEKPLYFGKVGETFVFASELKAFYAVPGFRPTVNRSALTQYFRYGYLPAPYSIFAEVQKLTPGTWLRQFIDGRRETGAFWSLAAAAEKGVTRPFAGTQKEAEDALEKLLADSVAKRLLSDVPLGAFLSGGIDSSLIVALMQKSSPQKVKTFTIGFAEREYDESRYAKAVAEHLGTDHHEQRLSVTEALGLIPTLAQIFDEPLGDASQLPTYLVSRCAREGVTVAISGDGGDELFGGYPRYAWGEKIWEAASLIPAPLRALMGQGVDAVSPRFWEGALGAVKEMFPQITTGHNAAEKFRKFSDVIKETNPRGVYRTLVTQWPSPELLTGQVEIWPESRAAEVPAAIKLLADQMMYWDQSTYLCDDVLTKVDRASMAVSLEVRAPLLDHRIVELAWSFPKAWKIGGGNTKSLLRQVLYRHVPARLVDRPKQGFSLPVDQWLRKELRDWAEALLSEDRLKRDGLLKAGPIRRAWEAHRSGAANHQHALWSVLMFQSWLERLDHLQG